MAHFVRYAVHSGAVTSFLDWALTEDFCTFFFLKGINRSPFQNACGFFPYVLLQFLIAAVCNGIAYCAFPNSKYAHSLRPSFLY